MDSFFRILKALLGIIFFIIFIIISIAGIGVLFDAVPVRTAPVVICSIISLISVVFFILSLQEDESIFLFIAKVIRFVLCFQLFSLMALYFFYTEGELSIIFTIPFILWWLFAPWKTETNLDDTISDLEKLLELLKKNR